MKIKARKWLDEWEHLINVANFEGARALFADDVVSFGTYAEVLHGLDQLEELQWRKVWPNIANFSFEEPSILVREGGIATIVVLWHSRGQDERRRLVRKARARDADPRRRQERASLHPFPSFDGTGDPAACLGLMPSTTTTSAWWSKARHRLM